MTHRAETFDDDQYASVYPDGIERHYWHRARTSVLARALDAEGLRGAPLLEIGCGRGHVTGALRDAGFDCTGVELAPAVPPARLSPFVRTGLPFQDLPAAERERVRGALLLDVLEHVDAPVAFLAAIRSSLPRVERLILTVPGRAEVWSEWDELCAHRCRYDVPTLTGELRAAAWTVRRTRYFFHGLYPIARVFTALGLPRSTRVVAPARPALHDAVARWFVAESRLLPGFVPGTSLLAIAAPG